jgi:hypothetical protein
LLAQVAGTVHFLHPKPKNQIKCYLLRNNIFTFLFAASCPLCAHFLRLDFNVAFAWQQQQKNERNSNVHIFLRPSPSDLLLLLEPRNVEFSSRRRQRRGRHFRISSSGFSKLILEYYYLDWGNDDTTYNSAHSLSLNFCHIEFSSCRQLFISNSS